MYGSKTPNRLFIYSLLTVTFLVHKVCNVVTFRAEIAYSDTRVSNETRASDASDAVRAQLQSDLNSFTICGCGYNKDENRICFHGVSACF